VSGREILFISHDASATGAPYVLLLLLEWLKAHSSLQMRIVLAAGGPHVKAFQAVAPTYELAIGDGLIGRLCLRFARAISWRMHRACSLHFLKRYVAQHPVALIYSNTITNGAVLSAMAPLRIPVITHVHELSGMFEQCRRLSQLDSVLRHTTHFIAVAHIVKENLISNHGIDPARTSVIPGFIPFDKVNKINQESARQSVRRLLGIAQDAYVFVACGQLHARKGPDLFVAVCREVIARAGPRKVNFLWVGGNKASPEYANAVGAGKRSGLGGCIHFVGHRTDYLEYIAAADAFVMTSREDPFPLVVLESAALGKPVICFDDAGGAPEFVRNDAGISVPFEDVNAMALACIKLLDSPSLGVRFGAIGCARAFTFHSVGVGASKIGLIIESVLRGVEPRLDNGQAAA
jgi:glycosyltransferase involved in cell wall biosynthesis